MQLTRVRWNCGSDLIRIRITRYRIPIVNKFSDSERLVGPKGNILCHMLRDRALARKFGPEAGPEIWHGGRAGNVAR